MKPFTVVVDSYKYQDRFESFSKHFDGSLHEDCKEFTVEIENSFGSGNLKGINFDSGMSLQMFDVNFNHEIDILYDMGRRHPISFLYVKEGSVEVINNLSGFKQTITENEALIYAPEGDSTYSILMPNHKNVKMVQVNVVRYLFLQKIECDLDTIPEPLAEMFRDTTGEKPFYYATSSDPSSLNAITNLFNNKQSGLERKLHMESYATKLITSLIKTFRIEHNPNNSGYVFTKNNIKLINEAKNYILKNIRETPTVKVLSRKLGINTNKLQKGFQLLFNKSVRQFIITAKLHVAQQLIEEGDMTISEIADHLGYTNKGHFSQLFKKEFGILPSEYNIRSRK
ncbi:helix-turn-helix domain-containing protein [Portibacter lacus]|uniref:AraC family transcriptional regulator n=1 Tax=Portibacter lacus TaxID=1099794 RepID=A0AA37WDL9_9BACT|nr:AraC family transcriptional regulator [Portibacter lacus]GLR17053.1 AraC family transcriptional regulator [Portibacter lacus]